MKLTVLLLILAVTQVVQSSKRKQKGEESNRTDKRALEEGNAGIHKRNPVGPAFPASVPGIEYADSGNSEKRPEKSPSYAQKTYNFATTLHSQQREPIISTPFPQQAKISDVITGQGPPYQAAIVSHLYSPFSVYQPRLDRYEVSAPVPAQLAYSEKITYQSTTTKPVTGVNYAKPTRPQPEQAIQTPKQLQPVHVTFGLPPQNPSVNQLYEVQPDYEYPNEAQFISKYHPNYLETFQNNYKPGFHQVQIQYVPQQPTPVRTVPPPPIPSRNVIPGVKYAKVEKKENLQNPLKEQQLNDISNVQPHVHQRNGQVSYASQSENAISYASFSIAPTPSQAQPDPTAPTIKYRPQYQLLAQAYQTRPPLYPEVYKQTQYLEPQIQQIEQHQPPHKTPHQTPIAVQQDFNNQHLKVQQPQHSPQLQLQGQHYQLQNQNQYHLSQNQFTYFHQFPGHDVKVKAQSQPHPFVSNFVDASPTPKLLYSFNPEPEVNQPQIYPPQALVVENPQQLAPKTYQNVQFHGKYAPEIFRDYKNGIPDSIIRS